MTTALMVISTAVAHVMFDAFVSVPDSRLTFAAGAWCSVAGACLSLVSLLLVS